MGLTSAARTRFMNRALAVLNALYPSECVIGGTTYPCAENSQTITAEMGDGGRVMEGVVVLRIARTLLATAPAIGSAVDMADGRKLKVSSVSPATHDVAWTIQAEPRHSR